MALDHGPAVATDLLLPLLTITGFRVNLPIPGPTTRRGGLPKTYPNGLRVALLRSFIAWVIKMRMSK